jgi:hypothetical protein
MFLEGGLVYLEDRIYFCEDRQLPRNNFSLPIYSDASFLGPLTINGPTLSPVA